MPAIKAIEGGKFISKVVAPWATGKLQGPIYSGFADEAGLNIKTQIAAHRALGLSHIDLRLVELPSGGKANIMLADDETFSDVVEKLENAQMSVRCVGSSIANWKRKITDDLKTDLAELDQAIFRMRSLDAQFLRIMSWLKVPEIDDATTLNLVIERLRELVKPVEGTNIRLLIENCAGIAGESPDIALKIIETIDSPNLAYLWDTGNTVDHFHGWTSWEFYQRVKPYIYQIHIKDGYMPKVGEMDYTLPGLGTGMLDPILIDLIRSNFCGVITLEPHILTQIHRETAVVQPSAEQLYDSYLLYGKAFMARMAFLREFAGFQADFEIIRET